MDVDKRCPNDLKLMSYSFIIDMRFVCLSIRLSDSDVVTKLLCISPPGRDVSLGPTKIQTVTPSATMLNTHE